MEREKESKVFWTRHKLSPPGCVSSTFFLFIFYSSGQTPLYHFFFFFFFRNPDNSATTGRLLFFSFSVLFFNLFKAVVCGSWIWRFERQLVLGLYWIVRLVLRWGLD